MLAPRLLRVIAIAALLLALDGCAGAARFVPRATARARVVTRSGSSGSVRRSQGWAVAVDLRWDLDREGSRDVASEVGSPAPPPPAMACRSAAICGWAQLARERALERWRTR